MALRKYEEPVELNKGIYWIGYYDSHDGLHCNPYLHSPGSFATYDEETGTLFSSDLFGYYGSGFELIVRVKDQCHMCDDLDRCGRSCILKSLYDFHRRIMPCREALKYGINALRKYEISTLAPQHGSILNKKEDIDFVMDKIYNLDNVGIERYLKGD